MKPTEAAKLARRDLKAAFPGVRFSLRCRYYNQFDVTWTDGPSEDEVSRVLDTYEGWESVRADDLITRIPDRPEHAVIKYINYYRAASDA